MVPSEVSSPWLQIGIRHHVVRALGGCLLLALWCFCNPYFEIDRSSLIYTGRALADLDPAGVGRDMMFCLDGQSSFTIFTEIYKGLATAIGVATATLLISISSVVASFVGVYVLASAVCAGRAKPLAIVFAAALPACYGGYKIFSFSETAATPRPFAEALILCAIAALLNDKRWLAIVLMLGATILHPIMAVPGLFLAIVWLTTVDRRWLVAVVAVVAIGLSLAALHANAFERFTTIVDPTWKAVLIERNPQLFPTLWPEGWAGRMAVRIATLLIGASLATSRVRNLYLLTLGIGLTGFGTAYCLADRWPIVILVQAQVWRTMWLVFALATIAAATCTTELWRLGNSGRVALALLALGWIFADHDHVAILLAVAALGSRFALSGREDLLSRKATAIVLASAALVGVAGLLGIEVGVAGVIGNARADDALSTLALDWDYTPMAVAAGSLALAWRGRVRVPALLGALACAVALAWATWDRRSAETLAFDAGVAAPDLAHITEGRQGEVFWIGGTRESWLWLSRPQWLTPIQGAGLVFSRPLALLYRDRARRAVGAGLDDGGILSPWADHRASVTAPDASKVEAFCSAPDAPAWIVAPMMLAPKVAARLGAMKWTAPITKLAPNFGLDGELTWRRVSEYSVIPCARSPS